MTDTLDEFRRHLKASGLKPRTVQIYVGKVRSFLNAVGTRLDRVTEDQTRAYFAKFTNRQRTYNAMVIKAFLAFEASRLPVVVDKRVPKPAAKRDAALQRRWSADKLTQQKQKDDDLIAQLARKVIDAYIYFESRMKGEPENLDDVYRLRDEFKDIIERNLGLFMGLSAQGRNIHSAIDERVQR